MPDGVDWCEHLDDRHLGQLAALLQLPNSGVSAPAAGSQADRDHTTLATNAIRQP